jgi:hypothetical protein
VVVYKGGGMVDLRAAELAAVTQVRVLAYKGAIEIDSLPR